MRAPRLSGSLFADATKGNPLGADSLSGKRAAQRHTYLCRCNNKSLLAAMRRPVRAIFPNVHPAARQVPPVGPRSTPPQVSRGCQLWGLDPQPPPDSGKSSNRRRAALEVNSAAREL